MGSLPGDSCIHQLLAVSHGIFLNFDCNATLETEGAFLDISKTLDRVWHDGLLFKLKQNGVPGNLFQLIKSFLSGRFQRVLHNGQLLYWETIQIGVPDNSNSNLNYLLVMPLFSEICGPLETANVLNSDLRKIRKWAEQ